MKANSHKLLIALLFIFLTILVFSLVVTKNSKKTQNDYSHQKTTEEEDSLSDPELYKDPLNYPHLIGAPIIKDIDNDGKTEKILRYSLSMADRVIQVLYIYRDTGNDYKLIKTFYGDPYGFAKITGDNIITVGRFLSINDSIKNWDEFSQFEITKYKWTPDGEKEISKDMINSASINDLSDSIKSNFYDDISDLTYNQVFSAKIDPEISPTIHKNKYDGKTIEWDAKISKLYTQITGIKFCILDEEHQNIDIKESCDWFWASSDATKDADIISINPDWGGHWVPYILNYYNVSFDEDSDYFNETYTIKGIVNGADCGADKKCVPNIEIIDIEDKQTKFYN